MQIHPHLNFNGQCEAAFKFYAQVLGGKIDRMARYEDMPSAEPVSPELRGRVMHAQLSAGGAILMGADAPPDHYRQPQGFSITFQTKDPGEADRVFQGLSESGTVSMPIQETFWAARFGMLVDRFGIPWMVNCDRAATAAPGRS